LRCSNSWARFRKIAFSGGAAQVSILINGVAAAAVMSPHPIGRSRHSPLHRCSSGMTFLRIVIPL
jgi:hypothetical protein